MKHQLKVRIPLTLIVYVYLINCIFGVSCVCRCYKDDLNSCTSMNNRTENCICDGSLKSIFIESTSEFQILTLKNFKAEVLTPDDFNLLKESSVLDLTITNFFELKHINESAFNKFVRLKSLFISKTPKLVSVSLEILKSKSRNYLSYLSITKSALEHVPYIDLENQLFNLIDFEANSIHTIKTNNIATKSNQLIFNYNNIACIEKWAFNNSQISEIRFRGNKNLQILTDEAFYGLSSLTILDLSETSIISIPASGLLELEILIMGNTYTLKEIPTIYDFPIRRHSFLTSLLYDYRETRNEINLTRAELTFSFHCCAFRLPERHDPEKYARYESLRQKILPYCNISSQKAALNENLTKLVDSSNALLLEDEWHDSDVAHPLLQETNDLERNLLALSVYCTDQLFRKKAFTCLPVPNAFTPCEDIMGYTWLRICVWFIVVIGLFGNVCVLTVLLSKQSELNVPNFLITNLAFSDLCMACFLLMLAVEDFLSRGFYFNYAFDWQMGIGCKVAGFLTIFSSQLSIFLLSLLTIERWFTIKRALYLNKLTFHRTVYIAGFGWLYALIMATLPLLGVSSYSATSLCLPMDTQKIQDSIFVLFLLLVSSIAFFTICVCYYQIYFSLNYETRHKNGEYVLARKMIMLVGTNFLCWAPITFFATTATLGFPLIDLTRSKILLVFFYPLNSCANPFFYAILTTNFKKDLLCLLSKIGICKKPDINYEAVYHAKKDSGKIQIIRPITSHTTI